MYVKAQFPSSQYESYFESCFVTMWEEHLDLSKPPNLLIALRKVFDAAESEQILKAANDPDVKKTLTDNTAHAVNDLGAFGCPWFWVHDGKGKEEPFFGSDRFHYMWAYLELPHRDLELISPGSGSAAQAKL